MTISLSPFASILALVVACTTQTSVSLVDPPPSPPASCAPIDALLGCTAGAVAYACTGDRPDDGDTNLVCDDGTPGAGGDAGAATTLFCCASYGQWASACVPATDVPGCGAQSFGFSCQGAVSPDQVDTSIVCSGAIARDGGARGYCCAPFAQSASVCRCNTFDEDSGFCGTTGEGTCPGAEIGFDCVPGHTPVEVNPLLGCPSGDGGAGDSGGTGTYCCATP